jgi:hypothetical protein
MVRNGEQARTYDNTVGRAAIVLARRVEQQLLDIQRRRLGLLGKTGASLQSLVDEDGAKNALWSLEIIIGCL